MSIRITAFTLMVVGLAIYAWKDWFKSLCGLIVMMAVIQHEDMPHMMMGIQGLNPWNLLMVSIALAWLASRRREGGDPLIDTQGSLIWRKVARREPRKLSRTAQALASRLHPTFRTPGLNLLCRPTTIDHESRPYHMAWILHAWGAGSLE